MCQLLMLEAMDVEVRCFNNYKKDKKYKLNCKLKDLFKPQVKQYKL